MKLGISNIAWHVEHDLLVANLLSKQEVRIIDVAPGKYFPQVRKAREKEISRVRSWWCDHGIAIRGMQSLLFGTDGLNVFGPKESRSSMLEHLRAVSFIGAGLGARCLVFGSPKNRDVGTLEIEQIQDIAGDFFLKLGDIAQENGVVFCLEPNPSAYGANFMTTAEETAAFVSSVNHPAIRMQFDTGAVSMNGENALSISRDYSHLIAHIHASEPHLVPICRGETDHSVMNVAVEGLDGTEYVCIEMRSSGISTELEDLDKSIDKAKYAYC